MSKAIEDILAERRRQNEVEGWSPEHDDMHSDREMARAAGCYATHAGMNDEARANQPGAPLDWPWSFEWWKPTTPRRDLVKAAALAIAEIERIDGRAAGSSPELRVTNPKTTAQFCKTFSEHGVTLPFDTTDEDLGTLVDAHGRPVLVVDVNRERTDEDVVWITGMVQVAVNTCGGFKARRVNGSTEANGGDQP